MAAGFETFFSSLLARRMAAPGYAGAGDLYIMPADIDIAVSGSLCDPSP